MDTTRTVGATERTRGVGRTDGQTDRVKPVNPQPPPPTTSLCEGIIIDNAFITLCSTDATAIVLDNILLYSTSILCALKCHSWCLWYGSEAVTHCALLLFKALPYIMRIIRYTNSETADDTIEKGKEFVDKVSMTRLLIMHLRHVWSHRITYDFWHKRPDIQIRPL